MAAPPPGVRVESPEIRGGALKMYLSTAPELIISGAAGTGKTVPSCFKIHYLACMFPGARILMCRKTAKSLTTGAIQTYEKFIVNKLSGKYKPKYFGGNSRLPACYRYSNGSIVVLGGLDKASKVLSSEYDAIYVNEASECTETDWEFLSTRLRSGVVPFQQLFGDTNPDAPTHWIKRREAEGKLELINSVHEDNPAYYNLQTEEWTEGGARYIARLDKLSGVRLLRLRKGLWVAADGLIYPGFDGPAKHLIDEADMPRGWRSWRRAWVIDFGIKNPFVWQEWVVSPDGDAYMVREIYRTEKIVQDHAADILRAGGREMIFDAQGQPTGRYKLLRDNPDPFPEVIICDHDAEDRRTFERHTGLKTIAANKAVKPGIEAVEARLRDDTLLKRPRIFFLRDALVERDEELFEARLPVCTVEEFPAYVWLRGANGKEKEEPRKEFDHGMDALRYFVAWLDNIKARFAGGRSRIKAV